MSVILYQRKQILLKTYITIISQFVSIYEHFPIYNMYNDGIFLAISMGNLQQDFSYSYLELLF